MEASLKETSYCPYVERTSTAIFSLTRQVQYLSIRNIQHDWVPWHLEKTMNNSTSIWDICLHLKRNTLDRHDCTCCTWSSFRPSILLCLGKIIFGFWPWCCWICLFFAPHMLVLCIASYCVIRPSFVFYHHMLPCFLFLDFFLFCILIQIGWLSPGSCFSIPTYI